jgi:hypothetical protein
MGYGIWDFFFPEFLFVFFLVVSILFVLGRVFQFFLFLVIISDLGVSVLAKRDMLKLI